MEDFDDDEFYENDEPAPKHTGFCGVIARIKKRPDRKLFPSMNDMLTD